MEQRLASLDHELDATLGMTSGSLLPFYGMMKYQLGFVDEKFTCSAQNRGKRIRALCCLLTHEAITDHWSVALPLAAAIELVHNFSIIHDDIQDESAERRHRPTVWKLWGKPQAINVGDGMYVLSHLALLRLRDKGVDTTRILKLTAVLGETCLSIAEGQYLDIEFENRSDVSTADYMQMASGKTAALLSASTQLGAMLASDNEQLISNYQQFGYHLGLSFQIIDDILGIWGDPKVTGKPVADDIIRCKKTLPIIYALEQDESGRLNQAWQKRSLGREDVRIILGLLDEVGAQDYAKRLADKHYRQAMTKLDSTGIENQAQDRLRSLARFLVEREF